MTEFNLGNDEVFKRIRETIRINITEEPFMKIMEEYAKFKHDDWKKEFIKRLRNKWLMFEFSDHPEENSERRINEIIDELAGKELTECTEFNLSEKEKINIVGERAFLKEDVREFIERVKKHIVMREKEAIEKIIGEGLTSKERDELHRELKEKLSDVIDKLAGKELNG